MWNRRFAAETAAVCLIFSAMACDKPTPPPEVTAATKPAPRARPTTMSLMNDPRKSLALSPLPFAVQAPSEWGVSRHGDDGAAQLTMLDGDLGSGELHVILSERDTISAERLNVIVAHAQKEKAKLKSLGGSVNVRDMGDVRVVERLEMPSAATTEPTDRLIDWRIDLYVPSGLKYEAYELKVIDMTDDAYQSNKTLLAGIFNTLAYTPPTAPPPF